MTIDYALENFHKELYGRSILSEDQGAIKKVTGTRIQLPKQETSNEASINLPTKGEKIDWNTIERPERKIRKHYRSVIESSHTT